MRVEVMATAELVTAQGIECRVWRGSSPKGVPFFMLVPTWKGAGVWAGHLPIEEAGLFAVSKNPNLLRAQPGTRASLGTRAVLEQGDVILVDERPLRAWRVLMWKDAVPKARCAMLVLVVCVEAGQDASEFESEATATHVGTDLEELVVQSTLRKLSAKDVARG